MVQNHGTIRSRFGHGFAGAALAALAWTWTAAAPPDASAASPDGSLATVARRPPEPLPGHPGNVFLDDENVRVALPANIKPGTRWRVLDERGNVLRSGGAEAYTDGGRLALGKPGVGWYRIEFLNDDGKPAGATTAAVLHRLNAATPQDSPVCTDSATAWFARRYPGREDEAQKTFASLAALAGINWIRDRLTWAEIEPKPGDFAPETRYDRSARHQTEQGLKTLQVFHSTPGWAVDADLDGPKAWKRYPRDLRTVYRLCKALAQRFHGTVRAWEPWNEGNIPGFGGHPINEMCSYQKAAYLGFKAGDPSVVVCWNVFAGAGNTLQTEGVLRNSVQAFFDTFNIHSYGRPEGYLQQFANARRAAADKPLWISECGIRLKAASAAPWGDLTADDARRQAAFIPKSYALSLYAGVNRHFFFIIGNYIERGVQFGLLRHDFTPRPGYCALAATGRFLAGAKVLGRLNHERNNGISGVAFHGFPDGAERDVLVLWADRDAVWRPPAGLKIVARYDYLGRHQENVRTPHVGPEPAFFVLPAGAASPLDLEPPPPRGKPQGQALCPVVLQISVPASRIALDAQAYRLPEGNALDFDLYVYNFGNDTASGRIAFRDVPQGWSITPESTEVRIPPLERRRIRLHAALTRTVRSALLGAWFEAEGDFGRNGRTVVAFRLIADPAKLPPVETIPLRSAADARAWKDNINRKATMTHAAAPGGGVLFEMHFSDTDPWGYPRLDLPKTDRPPSNADGLRLTVQLIEGRGTVRVQFVEEGGASYITTLPVDASVRTPQTVVALFRNTAWGQWSRPDANGRLDLDRIRTVLVGINSERNTTVRMLVRDLEWVRY